MDNNLPPGVTEHDIDRQFGNENMRSFYFSFGQGHAHVYGDITLDRDTIFEIEAETEEEARDRMFDLFGPKWSMCYSKVPDMSYFPRGIIKDES